MINQAAKLFPQVLRKQFMPAATSFRGRMSNGVQHCPLSAEEIAPRQIGRDDVGDRVLACRTFRRGVTGTSAATMAAAARPKKPSPRSAAPRMDFAR
jgi:hypothetical protein